MSPTSVCCRHRLIVEADGPFHQDSSSDVSRDAWLVQQGFRVLRFGNAEIHAERDRVLDEILRAAGRSV